MNRTETNKIEQVLSYARATLQVDPDHKLVLLEFIPVEERSPGEPGYYPVLTTTSPLTNPLREAFWSGRIWDLIAAVTYWAEIPEIAEEGE